VKLSGQKADWLSTLFDVGGIIGELGEGVGSYYKAVAICYFVLDIHSYPGGIAAGLISDLLRAWAVTHVVMIILAVPSVNLSHTTRVQGSLATPITRY